jgi:L-histidine Nalpha-methyltransferase / hercynylcysteine S-oxide synthase
LYSNDVTTIPASWATNGSKADLTVTNGVKGKNGLHVNGYQNGNGTLYTHRGHLPDDFLEGKSVRTVYGLVPLKYALDWPAFASYDELSGCAAWLGGRIPTFEEARSIYAWVEFMKKDEAERKLGKTVPAVNG